MYWCIHDLWGPINLVDSMVTELDDTSPYFTDDIGIVWGPPTDARRGAVGPARLYDSRHELWPLVVPSWLTCVMLLDYFSCKVYIDSNLYDTLRYGCGLLAVFKCRSANSIMFI
jgi:hypothetical protein